MLDAANQRPPMYLRVNQRHQSREQYLMKIMQSGITGKATPHSKHGILLDKPIDVEQLPGFNDGDVSVQELAAQLSVQLLDLQPGQRVLDACAAPGGKTGHILESEAGLKFLNGDRKRSQKGKKNIRYAKASGSQRYYKSSRYN